MATILRRRIQSVFFNNVSHAPRINQHTGGLSGFRRLCSNNDDRYVAIFSAANKARVQERLKLVKSPRKPRSGETTVKKAAVLVPMCTVNGIPSLLYTLRSANLSSHRGQVSFPGGNADQTDQDLMHTALRETKEELGVSVDPVNVWGAMNAVPGNYYKSMVTPILGDIGEVDINSLHFNRDEVAEVFTRSIESLCHADNIHYTRFRSGPGFTLPVYTGGQHRIWGLTAIFTHMTLSTLLLPHLYSFKLVHR